MTSSPLRPLVMMTLLATAPSIPGHAADLARQGAIDAAYTSHNAQTIPDLDASADGAKAYVNEAFLVLDSTAAEGGLLKGLSARCLGYGSYDPKGAFHEQGRCTFTGGPATRSSRPTRSPRRVLAAARSPAAPAGSRASRASTS